MILLISGEENFLSSKKLFQIKEKFSSKDIENSNLDEFDEKSFSMQDFIKSISSPPFLSDKRLIILKNILNTKLKKEDEKIFIEQVKKIPDFILLVIYEENKVQGKIFAEIEKISEKNWNYSKLSIPQLEKWADEEFKKNNSEIDKKALSRLVSFVGNDLWQLNQEINKLSTYKNKNNDSIQDEDIDRLVSTNINTNIFQLVDGIGEKNIEKTLTFLNNLITKGEEIIYLLRMMVYQLRNLIIIKELVSRNLNKTEIAKITKKHPFVIEKTIKQSRNFSADELEKMYSEIFETELKIKNGKLEPKIASNILATKLCIKK